jgi:signal transduction histidine kinase
LGKKSLQWIADVVRPDEEPELSEELDRRAVIGLRAIAGLSLSWSLFTLLAQQSSLPRIKNIFGLDYPLPILVIGLATLALSFWPRLPYPRCVGLAIGYLIVIEEMWSAHHLGVDSVEAEFFIPRVVIMVLLVILAALPLKPLHTMVLGALITLSYWAMPWVLGIEAAATTATLLIVINASLMATGLSAVTYHGLASSYMARRTAQVSFDELKRVQAQLLVAKNASSQMRFAAALSHELNSPVAALSSAFDTMTLAAEKERKEPENAARFRSVFETAAQSGIQSTHRLRALVERMKRLSNLDRAEEQLVDLNALVNDIVSLLKPELAHRTDVALDFSPMEPVKCRPQQVGAVLTNLVRNAAEAMDDRGTIHIHTYMAGGEAVIEVTDTGKGIPAEKTERIFDPDFKVEGQRVSTTNWGLFMSRGIIAEHGGRLDIESVEDQGTTATLYLPVDSEP